MTKKLSADLVRRHRAARLGLSEKIKDIIQLADANAGLLSTSFLTPYLSLIARGIKSPFNLLNKIQLQERELVRFRAMRGTLFILPKARIRMLSSAFSAKPRIINKYFSYWNLKPEQVAGAKKRVTDILTRKSLTQSELRSLLSDLQDQRITGGRSERGTVLGFLLHLLQLEGQIISEKVVVQNTVRNTNRYLSIDKACPYLQNSTPSKDSLDELIEWYFETQGPADLDDLAWWSGFNKVFLIKPMEKINLVEVEIGTNGRKNFCTPKLLKEITNSDDKPIKGVKLLPYEDPYLKGHKNRAFILSGVPEAAVYERGEARPTICVDGKVVGLWRFVEHGEDIRIGVELFDSSDIDTKELNAAKEEVIKFTTTHFRNNLDKFAKGIFTGTEPYA